MGRRDQDRHRDGSHLRLTGLSIMEVEDHLYWNVVLSMCGLVNTHVISFVLNAHTNCSRSGIDYHYSLKKLVKTVWLPILDSYH